MDEKGSPGTGPWCPAPSRPLCPSGMPTPSSPSPAKPNLAPPGAGWLLGNPSQRLLAAAQSPAALPVPLPDIIRKQQQQHRGVPPAPQPRPPLSALQGPHPGAPGSTRRGAARHPRGTRLAGTPPSTPVPTHSRTPPEQRRKVPS